MPTLSQLLQRNREWAERVNKEDPTFFEELAKEQHPNYLWIGCADSRVPSNQIMGLKPGEVFVHRNIANMVLHTDFNMLSVLQYAVDVLKVQHVIVAGHYGCGGVKAAMKDQHFGLIDNWLQNIQDVESIHLEELEPLDEQARFDRMCELNVLHQVDNLRRSPIVQDAWNRGQHVELHSWVYNLRDGHLTPLQDVITGNS